MVTRREFLKLTFTTAAGLALPLKWANGRAFASTQIPQTPLAGKAIPKYVDALPTFVGLRKAGASHTVVMQELQQPVLPASVYALLPPPFNAGTFVWGYQIDGFGPHYPGVTVEAQQGTPVTMTYVNNLNNLTDPPILQRYLTVDQTLHWASPLGMDMMNMNPYAGPPPAVVHLHGGEVPSEYDGGPDQWFTPDGLRGMGYRSLIPVGPDTAVYAYPNAQEATTLWFHDHTLGATRLNVYAGLAAFYLLRDDRDTGLPDNPIGLPAGNYEIEIVMQDRLFDSNGQWLFPDLGINPMDHPYWVPEFFGDTIVVNGKSWPFLNVEPRRYRFRLLDGSNARFYELRLMNKATKLPGPPMWAIGSDGGLLDLPVMLNDPANPKAPRLLMAPGERYDVIVDFSGYAGQTLTLLNSAKAPYPKGVSPDPQTVGEVMQFRVNLPLSGTDASYNPALGGALRAAPIVRLGNAVTPATPRRQMTLNEVMGMAGPLEVLVNNTKWSGKRPDGAPLPGATADGQGNYLSELPRMGDSEVWEIVNLTMDAHPIHLHLVQFQLLSRQAFNASKYLGVYAAAFPGSATIIDPMTGQPYLPGVYIPAFGPPLDYFTPSASGALGGNPDVAPYLQGPARLPLPQETGWKDTFIMYPGEVTRVAVRFAPQAVPLGGVSAGTNAYPFDPTSGPGYVWHCHIVDHEDNEMMRPYNLQP